MPPRLARSRRGAPSALAIAMLALGIVDRGHAPVTSAGRSAAGEPARAVASRSPAPRAAPPIAGWVVDGAGAPIAGVHARFRDAEVTAESDPTGALRFEPPAGATHTLLLDAPDVFPAELAWRTGAPPPRIMLARRARISIRVTANGAPVADAEVQITDGSRPTLATARTDRAGAARFDDLLPGPYELWARRDTMVSSLVRVADVAATEVVALAVEPAGSIGGQVLGDAPLPAGAAVQLVPLDVDHAARRGSLDGAGRFSIDGVPPGRWRIEASAQGYVDTTDRVVQARGDRADVTIQLVRAGAVTGTVIDAAGAPVAGATIVLRPQGAAAPARALDEAVPLGAARLRWVHPLAGMRQMPIHDGARFGASRPGTRPAECGRGHCGNDLGSQRGAIVHAAADGTIAAAYTELRGEAGRMVAIDHGDGLTTMYMHLDALRPGLEAGQRVRAGLPLGTLGSTGFALDHPHLHFAVTQQRAGRTWYIDPEPMLRHAVVLAAPRPLDRIDIAVRSSPTAAPERAPSVDERAPPTAAPERARAADAPTVTAAVRWSDLGATPVTAPATRLATDAHGRFRVDGVAPGSYVAAAFADQLAPGVSAAFAVRTGGETAGVVVALRPGVVVRGRVLGRDGAIDGATVTAAAGFGETANKVAMTYTNHAGEFVLRSLIGKVTLIATAPGYGALDRTIMLDDLAAHRREDFALVIEDARLRGQVLAHDGGAAGAVAIRVVEGPTRRSAISDDAGRFELDRVAAGSYLVEITSPEYPPIRAHLETAAWKELRFAPGGSVRVLLRDARTGAPLAGVRVDATGPDRATSNRVTDPTGVAELRGLVVGDWTVVARARGYSPVTRSVAITARRVPQDLRLDLGRGVVLAGVVRDRYGRRVAGARVSLGGVITQTDQEGKFRLDDAPTGSGWLEAEHQGARGALQLALAPGDERLTLTIELAE